MEVKCNMCDSEYVLRHGSFGYFCSCTNFPTCKSKIPLDEFIKKYIDLNGVTIYKWKEECEKCKKETDVISYFVLYELPGLDPNYMDTMNYISLGKIPTLDNYLLKKYPVLEGGKRIHNVCNHCKGYKTIDTKKINYIVGQLWHQEMDNHFLCNISKNELEIPQEELKNILN